MMSIYLAATAKGLYCDGLAVVLNTTASGSEKNDGGGVSCIVTGEGTVSIC